MPATITLLASSSTRTYPVAFYGEAAEDNALAFIARRTDLQVIEPAPANDDDFGIGSEFTRLLEVLYPSCQHGMSLDSCQGYEHYGTAEDDYMRDYYNGTLY